MKNFILFVLFCAAIAPAKEITDLQGMINRQIAEGKKTITIPSGRYYVKPVKRAHLTFSGLSDITIIADGVEMICTETTRAVTIEYCTNFTLRGMTIDYDPLPYTQGKIVKISNDRMSHEVEIFKGYPPADSAYAMKHAVFDAKTRRLKFGNYYTFKTEALPSNRLLITKGEPERKKDAGEQVGDLIVVASKFAPNGEMPHTVYCDNSVGTTLENITLYSAPIFGFLEVHCDGSVYRGCVVDRRSPETDYVQREPRLRSLNADAYHSKFARKGPQILNCTAGFMGDDCVNICGAYHLITQGTGDTLRVLAKTNMDIAAGDPVELTTVDGRRILSATVLSVKAVGKTTKDETAGLKDLPLLERIRGFLKEAYEIKIDREIDVPFGSVIASENRMGNGFSVKDCTFGNNRSRGILAKGSDGEISGNRIENAFMQAIKIAPEYQWLESGYSRNVLIKNNTIINCGMEAVFVHAFGEFPAHENISIINNSIQTDFSPVISIHGLRGGTISGNAVKTMNGGRVRNPVELNHCDDVTVQ